ncbi:hypothetical protein MASR2M47_35090 [Draconibacterium sp.]
MWKCKKCKEEVEDQFDVCWNCGSDRYGNVALDKEEQTTLKEIKTEIALENSRSKYPALRTIAGLYSLFAWIAGVIAVITAIYFLIQGESGLFFAIPILVIGVLIVLGVLAISESIMVLIDIEYNTRQKSKTK